MKIRLFQVDAFTDKPFKGNPAAVCLLEQELPEPLMQSIAAENNLAETAFLVKAENGYKLRWFTPTVEIALCGHATLASAHILYEEGLLKNDEEARFHTKSGLLTAKKLGNWIELDFPAASNTDTTLPVELKKALNIEPKQLAHTGDRYIIELATEEEVKACSPDFKILKDFDAVIITSATKAGSPYDFISRTFAPSHGIDEDPVTGSSHCALVPYWATKLGKEEMFAYQASLRGGELKVKYAGDRVLFSGEALTVIEGNLLL
ncbi:PhzF family phenazine biosynthesis protein [Desertivirga xinjiangensis]|uniref:PhzF family phenazine biosynthesis protein n=1 Tax=Desertivirga xinjiangensis TaxID=539206 RepID=UPI00210C0948|nr:PhzF family phenazine biosynthesis protein [Pedobacter xinjiangensis]